MPTISPALLHAVDNGRVQCSPTCEPDFFVDGLACCDHFAARTLVRDGLIRPVSSRRHGERIPVELTGLGRAAIGPSRRRTGRGTRRDLS